jgi:hypothetical protein
MTMRSSRGLTGKCGLGTSVTACPRWCAPTIHVPLTTIFVRSLNTGCVPSLSRGVEAYTCRGATFSAASNIMPG